MSYFNNTKSPKAKVTRSNRVGCANLIALFCCSWLWQRGSGYGGAFAGRGRGTAPVFSLAIWHPDCFELCGVSQEAGALAGCCGMPIGPVTFERPDGFEISCGGQFDRGPLGARRGVPERIDLVVIGQRFRQFCTCSCDDADNAARHVGCIKNLIEIGG